MRGSVIYSWTEPLRGSRGARVCGVYGDVSVRDSEPARTAADSRFRARRGVVT